MQNKRILFCCLCVLFCLTACQPTPEQPAVVNKNKDLSEQIKVEETETKHAQEVWEFEKEYSDNKKLKVNAAVRNADGGKCSGGFGE